MFGQVINIQDLSKLISKNSDSVNYTRVDSITTSFLNWHPEINDEKFQQLLGDLYSETNLKQLAVYYFVNGLFYEKKANYISALKAYLIAIEFIKENNANNYLVYYRTAYCYERLGYSQEAIDYYLKSVSYPGLKPDKLVEIYKNIGNCSVGLGKYEKSIKYYNKSYNAARLIGDTVTMIKTVINSGNTYLRAKNYLKASELTNKAYQLSKENNYYLGMAFTKYNMGLIDVETDSTQNSIKNFHEAIAIAQKYSIGYVFENCHLFLARSYLKQKNYQKSLKYIEKYIELVDEESPNSRILNAYKTKSEVLSHMGDYASVIKNNNKLIDVVDSILASNQKKYIENIKATRTLEINVIENKSLSKELEINRLKVIHSKKIIWLSMLAIVLLLIVLAQVFYAKRKQNKYVSKILIKNKIIAEKNSEIFQQSEEIQKSNESLLDYQQKLENKVSERTKALNEALEQAKQQSMLKSAFLKNISHEIRTPLNGILGFFQIISMSNPEIERKYLKIIEQSTHDLTNTVDSIIELAEIETGGIKVNIKEFSLTKFVGEIKDKSFFIRQNLVKEDIELIVSVGNLSNEANWVSDKNMLTKILYQLIHNSFKYTEHGKVVIDFNIIDAVFQIKISDTGIGMDKKYLDKIFEHFVKIEPQGKLYRGLGAGLSIVKNLSKNIGLEIDMQSEKNKGTTVLLTLPKRNTLIT